MVNRSILIGSLSGPNFAIRTAHELILKKFQRKRLSRWKWHNKSCSRLKVGTHDGTSRRELLWGLVPVTSTHKAHKKGPISVRLVAGTSPGSVYTKGLVAETVKFSFWLVDFLFGRRD